MRSEAELDERLEQLHYRIEHESIPLNEEKRILQQIKKLESQRAKVRGGRRTGRAPAMRGPLHPAPAGCSAPGRHQLRRASSLEGQPAGGEADTAVGARSRCAGLQVREYESLVGTLAESRTEVKRLEGELSEHKAELAALQAEKNTQWSILEKFREQVRRVGARGARSVERLGGARACRRAGLAQSCWW